MKCPYCHLDNDRVIDSRSSDENQAIRRRRECLSCKRRITTYERVEEPAIKVVKKDGVREPFQREKIGRRLEQACWRRPISDAEIETLISGSENDGRAQCEDEIDTGDVGELVMQHLHDLSQVVLVRFASVYREF